jgi:candicidin polyketide synthase FscB
VRVAIHAAGLNFRDVLIALGVYPGQAELGSEGAGTVVEVGDEVEDLAPGDRVMGLFVGCFGPLAVSERKLLAVIPEDWSDARAAGLPTVFLTAGYGLGDLAALGAGERVLIHGAAGGVGIAAVQIARHLGAEVFATAHPDKWETLRGLGIEDTHIASSRDLDFREKFLAATDGEGMDVVLDSLAGEFVDASLDLLPRGGRFIEMGKADIRDPEEVAAAHPGIAYRAFDLNDTPPERLQEMLVEIVGLFDAGVLGHLPITTFDIRRAPEAFRFLRESRHTGKVVLTVPPSLDPAGTVLITGATGGLGALLARHLVTAHGARRLLLTSRSGPAAEGAGELRAELEALGAEVEIAACDVADRDQLAARLDAVPGEHPLVGVIHAAGVIDDGIISSLDPDRLRTVMAPKVDGALNLHELTAAMPLAEFVLFSSISATIGAPGQANYAAANAFLDALAARRRAQGLPGLSIAWGAWENAGGMVGGLGEEERARLRSSGIGALADLRGLALFDAATRSGLSNLAAVALDRAALRSQAEAGTLSPLFGDLVRATVRRRQSAPMLAAMPAVEREAHVRERVVREVAGVLGNRDGQSVDPTMAFKEMGFDSLAAVELRNRLADLVQEPLPSTVVFDHPNATALAAYINGTWGGEEETGPKPFESMVDRLRIELSGAAVEESERRLLATRLRGVIAELEAGGRPEQTASGRDRFEDASDDELLEYLDEQVGQA